MKKTGTRPTIADLGTGAPAVRAWLRLVGETAAAIREEAERRHRTATRHAVFADHPECPLCSQMAASIRQQHHTRNRLHGDSTLADMAFLLALETYHLARLAALAGPLYTVDARPTADAFGTALAEAWGRIQVAHDLLRANNLGHLIHDVDKPPARLAPRSCWDAQKGD